jgi:hypothetical protein
MQEKLGLVKKKPRWQRRLSNTRPPEKIKSYVAPTPTPLRHPLQDLVLTAGP